MNTPDSLGADQVPEISNTTDPVIGKPPNIDNKSINGRPPTGAPTPQLPGSAPMPPGFVDPEQKMMDDTVDNLYLDIDKAINVEGINKDNNKDIENYLISNGWNEDRIREIKYNLEKDFNVKIKSYKELFNFIMNKSYNKMQDSIKKDVVPGAQNQSVANDIHTKRRKGMKDKVVVNEDGTLTKTSSSNEVKNVLSEISRTIRKANKALKSFKEAKVRHAGIVALQKKAEEMEELDEGLDMLEMDEDMGSPLEEAISLAEDLISKLKEVAGEGTSKLEEDLEEGEEDLDILEEKVEAALSMRKSLINAIKEAKDFMADKKDEKEDDKKEEDKEDKKEDDKKEDDKKEDDKKEASIDVDEIVGMVKDKMSELSKDKNAQLYPYKDLNKQQVDDTNAGTAKDQINTINSDMKGGFQSDSESISPLGIGDGKDIANESGAYNPPADGGKSSIDNVADNSKKISKDQADRVRQHSVQNAIDKTKLSFELAAQQQFKGLIDNPLKEAMVNNMVEAGIEKTAAEIIADNSFIDGYEKSFKAIKAEIDTFLAKDHNDFIKVAKYTKSYTKKASADVSEAISEKDIVKEASVDTSIALRPSEASKDNKETYSKYWEGVSRERRKW